MLFSIITNLTILILLIAIIEISKHISYKKYFCKQSNIEYVSKEFKVIFFTTFIFMITLLIASKAFLNYEQIMESETFLNMIKGSIYAIFINSILFLGYISQLIIRIEDINFAPTALMIFREDIYGPILEEVIYRGIIFNLFFQDGFSKLSACIISSVLFGLSHIRHIFDHDFTKDRIGSVIFQSIFTTIFGFYTCYVYYKTGTLISSIILHSYCNILKLPKFDYLSDPRYKISISFLYALGIVIFYFII